MADFGQFFQPVLPNMDQAAGAWDVYLNDPRTQAALLSFGAQAAQPRQWGQSDFGHLMSSVAQGGAGVRQEDAEQRKGEELDIKRQESDTKSSLRESQATLAESRAAHAGSNAANAEGRLALRERELDQRNHLQLLQRQIQGNRLYQEYVRRTQKANQDAAFLPASQRNIQPIQSFQEWLAANPMMMQNLGLTPEQVQSPAPGGAGTGAPSPASTSGSVPAPAPQAPQGPPPPIASRPDGYIHNDPQRGRLRWDRTQQRWFPVGAPQ